MRIDHIAMYVTDLEKAKDFFVKYFNAAADENYHNKQTGFRSYFLSFDDGARLEIMTNPQMTMGEKALDRTGYIHIHFLLHKTTRFTHTDRKVRPRHKMAAVWQLCRLPTCQHLLCQPNGTNAAAADGVPAVRYGYWNCVYCGGDYDSAQRRADSKKSIYASCADGSGATSGQNRTVSHGSPSSLLGKHSESAGRCVDIPEYCRCLHCPFLLPDLLQCKNSCGGKSAVGAVRCGIRRL